MIINVYTMPGKAKRFDQAILTASNIVLVQECRTMLDQNFELESQTLALYYHPCDFI
jgi:hypothetical protein